MTKEQFLNGTPFSLDYDYSYDATYVYNNPNGRDKGSLSREYRTKEGKVVLSDHLMNIDKIGNTQMKAYSFDMMSNKTTYNFPLYLLNIV